MLALADALAAKTAHIVVLAGPVPPPGVSITGTFPFVMRIASRIVLAFSGAEFAQSAGMARSRLLNGLDEERVRWACSRFTTESKALVQEPLHWSGRPPAPCTYIRCLRDRGALSPSYQEQMAANLGPTVKMVSLETCHYAMLERPHDVARILNDIADSMLNRGQ